MFYLQVTTRTQVHAVRFASGRPLELDRNGLLPLDISLAGAYDFSKGMAGAVS